MKKSNKTGPEVIEINEKIMKANDQLAAENHQKFVASKIKGVFNLISSPGAGKTTLLEKIAPQLSSCGVIEGDIATARDAERLFALSIPVVQINTMGACHLDASMIAQVRDDFPFDQVDYLFIENVGNLVCPTGYDLGEDHKIVVLSLPEGADKPVKYPAIFRKASICVINKLDLEPYCGVDLQQLKTDIYEVNPNLKTCEVSCQDGTGIDRLIELIKGLSPR